jgi:4a-hydroxytetrahydrobiopterin dehydratase
MAVPESEQRLPEPLLTELLGELAGWQRDGQSITKTFTLTGWKTALAFVNKVGDAAVRADHHPDIHIERYKTVRIVLTTHVTQGISQADIDLATEIDRIAAT